MTRNAASRISSTRRRPEETRTALLLLAPTLIILLALAIYPILYAGHLSLQIRNLFNPNAAHFGGMSNYYNLLLDDHFWKSIRVTTLFTVLAVSLQICLGFALALMLDKTERMSGLLRTLIIIPVFISPIAMGMTWRFMFEPVSGIINWILRQIGLSGSLWLSGSNSALPAIIIADTWQWVPFVALIFLAGIRAIPGDIVEAARIDRLSPLQRVTWIIIPLLWPVLVIVLLIRIVDSIRIFDLVYIMTRGGPGTATLTASVYNYTIFQSGRIGMMAAFGFVLLIFINILVLGVLRLMARTENRNAA